jgi:hypothetical protein
MTQSPQTLSEHNRRLVAEWAAACAERVLPLFEVARRGDPRRRAAIARARAFSRGDADTAVEIRERFSNGGAAREAKTAEAAAAARSAGQAASVSHMGAHALGAASYAIKAVYLASPDGSEIAKAEMRWQLARMSPEVRSALRALPAVGEDRSGPLGPGLLASGQLGTITRELQASLAQVDPTSPR